MQKSLSERGITGNQIGLDVSCEQGQSIRRYYPRGKPYGAIMEHKDSEFFKKELLKLREEVLNDAETTADVGAIKVTSEDLPDVVDRSSMETDRNFTLRLLDRERKLLKKIDEALLRIENGEFGICESCGEDIARERLVARPVATLCIGCKQAQEEEQEQEKV
jgi:DnaK suppressor protein